MVIQANNTRQDFRKRRRTRHGRIRCIIAAGAAGFLAILTGLWACQGNIALQEGTPPVGTGRPGLLKQGDTALQEGTPIGTGGPGFLKEGSTEGQAALVDVPFLSQIPDFPTGCESVTAVMALQYFGIDIAPGDFIDDFLPLGKAPYRDETGTLRGCDPREAFPGNPRSETGWGCYAPVIARALKEAAGPGFSVQELSGHSLRSLCQNYIGNGIPVLLWVTIDMDPPMEGDTWLLEDSGEPFTWIEPMHCALLVGYDKKYFYFNDPLAEKNTPYPREAVETAYAALSCQAVVLLPEEP